MDTKTELMVNRMFFSCYARHRCIMSAVPGRFVALGQYTGNQVQVTLADLSVIQMNEASVNIEVEGKCQSSKVLVSRDGTPDILLGTDHQLTGNFLRIVFWERVGWR